MRALFNINISSVQDAGDIKRRQQKQYGRPYGGPDLLRLPRESATSQLQDCPDIHKFYVHG